MTNITKTLAMAALITALAGGAIAQTSHGHSTGSSTDQTSMQKMMDDMMPKASDAASTKDFKEADMGMMKNMHVAYTGNADVDFRTHMIPHHQGAIDMAQVALKHAKNEETKKMAQKIIDDQKNEIAEMQLWLKANGNK